MRFETFKAFPEQLGSKLNEYEMVYENLGVVHVSELTPDSRGQAVHYVTVVYNVEETDETVQGN